ncbi:MAG: nickel pincer cofactor biosynthesis protein LarB [Candidatus Melainabacteria bacterium]|nr:MAG: nickel pincer cofactor biosynthesis protein LarB [Candidatus Melainabacteria bacterium]
MTENVKVPPFENLDFACVDHDRAIRQGVGEVIFAPGKTADQIVSIAQNLLQSQSFALATRVSEDQYEEAKSLFDQVHYFKTAKIMRFGAMSNKKLDFSCGVLSAGTSDIPVAEEAAVFLEHYGVQVSRVFDVGVAGIHRLLARVDEFNTCNAVIVVAGMDGALPSVVGGLLACPVIAVPTSIGYGTAFGGITALMTMLNSCASGVAVVNIDNGFGAAMAVLRQCNQLK